MQLDIIGKLLILIGIILALVYLMTPHTEEIISLQNIIPIILNTPLLLGMIICYLVGVVLILLSAFFV